MPEQPTGTEFLGVQHNEKLVHIENYDRSALFSHYIYHPFVTCCQFNASNIQLLFFVFHKMVAAARAVVFHNFSLTTGCSWHLYTIGAEGENLH